MKTPKQPDAVTLAQGLVDRQRAEIQAIDDRKIQLERELAVALATLHKARLAADDGLPQCRVVEVQSGQEKRAGRVVLLRKTPKGSLVARWLGRDAPSHTCKHDPEDGFFKFEVKYDKYRSACFELRDVPEAFASSSLKEPS